MDRSESGRRVLTLELEDEERQAALFGARMEGIFADVTALTAQFPAKTAPVTRTLADWEARTGRLRTEFSALGSTMGQSVVIAMTPAAEAMEGFIASAQRAAESFRSFVWSLFGGKTQEAADGLDALGSSAAGTAKKVSGAAASVKRSLMAFDRINRLTETAGSGGSGRSSAGTGVERDELIAASPFGEYLRSLMEDDRYFDMGAALAAKLGEIIDGLDAGLTSERFRMRVSTALGRLTETVNGFLTGLTFREQDRLSVAGRFGDFVGDAIGLGLESIHGVLTRVSWDKLGTAAAQFVNGALLSLKAQPVDFGTVAADWANTLMRSLDGFLSHMDWTEVGASVGRNITSWFAAVDWELAGRTLRDGITGLRTTVISAIENMDIRWGDIISAFGRGLLAEDHPGLSRLLFGDGIDVPVTGVSDETPKKAKVLSGFAARLASWAESFTGVSGEKIIEFTAGISSWTDRLRERVVGAMTARFTASADGLSEEQKTITATAKYMLSRDELSEAQKTISGTVKYALSRDELSGAQKTISTTARYSDAEDNLPASKKTIGGLVGKLTDWSTEWKSNPWSYIKAYFNDYENYMGSPWAYVKAYFNAYESWFSSLPWVTAEAYFQYYDATPIKGVRIPVTGQITAVTKAAGGVYANGGWRPVTAYAGGGLPSGGQLFLAREAGPELVGTLGGHTAVMNNDQIVASVSAGVARAIAGLRFYAANTGTPHLAVIGSSVSRSEQYLSAMAKQAETEAAGGTAAQTVVLLRQILETLTTMDFDVKMDGTSVKDRIVQLVNADTRATGVCEITI